MKTKSRGRCTVSVARWFSYAAAGAATALAASNDADAGILYSGVLDTPISFGQRTLLLTTLAYNPRKVFGKLILDGNSGNGLALFQRAAGHPYIYSNNAAGYGNRPYRLVAGESLDRSHFNPANQIDVILANGSSSGVLAFGDAGTGFLGFEIARQPFGVEQYGWVRIDMTSGPPNHLFTVVDYAIGTPGQAMEAGAYALAPGGGFLLVPEPASLGLLAVGAAGLLAMRGGTNRARGEPPRAESDAA